MAMRASVKRLMEGTRITSRCFFTGDKGRVLSEEERAIENVYIQKMERERLEKLRQKLMKEKAAGDKGKSEKKVEEEAHKG